MLALTEGATGLQHGAAAGAVVYPLSIPLYASDLLAVRWRDAKEWRQ
jgi:hypothetical protein